MLNKFLKHKKLSIRNKILLPFLIIITIFAVSLLIVAITITSKNMEQRVRYELKQQVQYIKSSLEKQVKSTISYSNILADVSGEFYNTKNPSKGLAINNKMQAILNKEDINFYKNYRVLEQKNILAYNKLIKAGLSGKTRRVVVLENINNKIQVSIAAVAPAKINNGYEPIITEFKLSNDYLDKLQEKRGYEAAYIISSKFRKKIKTEILAATKLISTNTDIQNQLIKAILEPSNKRLTNFFVDIKTGDNSYKAIFEKMNFKKNLFAVVIVPNNDIHKTSIRIIISAFIMLTIISIWLFLIYSIIIKKIIYSLEKFHNSSKEIIKGNFENTVDIDSGDEIEDLANIFNQMIESIKEAETDLKNEKDRLAAIISNIPVGIILTDTENNLILANNQAEQMFQFSINPVKGKTILQYIDNEEILKALIDAKTHEKEHVKRELQIEINEGQEVPSNIMLTSCLLRNRKKENIGIITVIRDITHQRELEELRDGFLKTATHELRTPLTSIIGFIELLNTSEKEELERKKYLDIIYKEAKDLKIIIDDLLDLSKIKAGTISMHVSNINIYAFLDRVTQSFKPLADNKKVVIENKFTDHELMVEADAVKLKRILGNLVSNSLKFTNKGMVSINCELKEDWFVFSVTDTGIGLKPEERKDIFKKFRRTDYSENNVDDGIGLGLSIVHNLVQLHKGEISVESEYGKGSVFSFTIPKT